MAHRTKVTAKAKTEFIEQLGKDGNVTRSAAAVGISRRVLYDRRKTDKPFADQWDTAVKMGDRGLIDEAVKRAHSGSDSLLMFLIKARYPKYKDKLIELPESGTFNLQLNFTQPAPPEAIPVNQIEDKDE